MHKTRFLELEVSFFLFFLQQLKGSKSTMGTQAFQSPSPPNQNLMNFLSPESVASVVGNVHLVLDDKTPISLLSIKSTPKKKG